MSPSAVINLITKRSIVDRFNDDGAVMRFSTIFGFRFFFIEERNTVFLIQFLLPVVFLSIHNDILSLVLER